MCVSLCRDGICESMVDLLNVLSYTEEWSDFEGDYAGVISDLIDLLQRKSLVKSANGMYMHQNSVCIHFW